MIPTQQQINDIQNNIVYENLEDKIKCTWDKYDLYLYTWDNKNDKDKIIESSKNRIALSFWNLTQQTQEFQSKYVKNES